MNGRAGEGPLPPAARDASTRHRERVVNAMCMWRSGERELRQPQHAPYAAHYERAISLTLQAMQHLTTMDSLLAAYFDGRRESLLCVERACRSVRSRRPISRILVREAAFWRRLRQVVAAHLGAV